MNPTGSFKDNGMTTGISQARALGASAVACASTGNTSASMAAYAARARLPAYVLIPAGQVALGKLSQALEYGATVVEVDGNFDAALRIVRELTDETDLYLLNSVNPFRLEGQKTIMIELMEQLSWKPPDWVVLPGGNLGNVSAFGKALREMATNGFIDRIPRLAVIQAERSAPFYELFKSADRSRLVPVDRPETLATAIRIGKPVSWKKALRSLEWTDGLVETVTEQEIADAKAMIGRAGIGCEPASASALAGLKRLAAAGVVRRDEEVVCVLTGNLLKDPDYTVNYHGESLAAASLKSTFANRPIQVAADKGLIRRALSV
jgi:threonine synthase